MKPRVYDCIGTIVKCSEWIAVFRSEEACYAIDY